MVYWNKQQPSVSTKQVDRKSDVKPTSDKLYMAKYRRKWEPKSFTMDRTTARMYQTCRKQHKTYQFVGNHILKTKFHVCSSTSRRALSLKQVTEWHHRTSRDFTVHSTLICIINWLYTRTWLHRIQKPSQYRLRETRRLVHIALTHCSSSARII